MYNGRSRKSRHAALGKKDCKGMGLRGLTRLDSRLQHTNNTQEGFDTVQEESNTIRKCFGVRYAFLLTFPV